MIFGSPTRQRRIAAKEALLLETEALKKTHEDAIATLVAGHASEMNQIEVQCAAKMKALEDDTKTTRHT